VKDKGTFRERLSVIDFLLVLEKGFVRNWSTDRSKTLTRVIEGEFKTEENKKYVPFMKEPEISISEYTLSYQWNLEEKKFKKYKANDIFDLFADMPTTTNAMAINISVLGENILALINIFLLLRKYFCSINTY